MTTNDGKGIFDKYGMLEEIKKKLDIIADTKGALRGGLIWDVYTMIGAVKEGLEKEDEAHKQKIEILKKEAAAAHENHAEEDCGNG